MARITVEDVYCGEKYNVLSAAGAEFLTKGRPAGYSRQTWLELLLVKHTTTAFAKTSTATPPAPPPLCARRFERMWGRE